MWVLWIVISFIWWTKLKQDRVLNLMKSIVSWASISLHFKEYHFHSTIFYSVIYTSSYQVSPADGTPRSSPGRPTRGWGRLPVLEPGILAGSSSPYPELIKRDTTTGPRSTRRSIGWVLVMPWRTERWVTFLINMQTLELWVAFDASPSVEALLDQIPIAFGILQLMMLSTL